MYKEKLFKNIILSFFSILFVFFFIVATSLLLPIVHPSLNAKNEEILSQFTRFNSILLTFPEHEERLIYQLTVLFIPIAAFLANFATNKIPTSFYDDKKLKFVCILLPVLLTICLLAATYVPSGTGLLEFELVKAKGLKLSKGIEDTVRNLAKVDYFRAIGLGDFKFIMPISVVAIAFSMLMPSYCSHIKNALQKKYKILLTIFIFGTFLAMSSFKLFSWKKLSELNDFWIFHHFNPVLYYSLLANENVYTTAFGAPQYGFYAFYLKPVFWLIGLNVFNFSFVMTIIYFISIALLSYPLFKLVENKILKLVLITCLCAFHGLLGNYIENEGEPYFQYYPIRFFFPAVSVFLIYNFMTTISATRKFAITLLASFILGFCIFWNMDSGIVTAVAWLGFMGLLAFAETLKNFSLKHFYFYNFIIAIIMILIGVTTATLILKTIDANGFPFDKLFISQKLFYYAGLCMLPMPLYPHPWMIVAATYITVFSVCFPYFFKKDQKLTTRIGLLMYLTIIGIGLFSYYQGRSHDLNLPAVLWPALSCCFIISDHLLAISKYKLSQTRWLVFPFAVLLFALILRFIWVFLPTVKNSEAWRMIFKYKQNIVKQNVFLDTLAWLSEFSGENGDTVLIFHPVQSIFYVEAGFSRVPKVLPSYQECMITNEQVTFVKNYLASGKVKHLLLPNNWRDDPHLKEFTYTIDRYFELKGTLTLEHFVYKERQ